MDNKRGMNINYIDRGELGMFNLLPFELCIQILSLLPAKSLLVLRAVCKWLMAVIDDPEFVSFHFRHFPDNLNKTQILTAQRQPDSNESGWYIEYSVIPFGGGCRTTNEQIPLSKNANRWYVQCSLDGLFVVTSVHYIETASSSTEEVHVLWNPSIRKYRQLPSVMFDQFALGYHNNDYKVFAVGWNVEAWVYSVKTSSWTDVTSTYIKNNFEADVIESYDDRVSFNDGVVWIGSKYLVWFDFGTESFRVSHDAHPTEPSCGRLVMLDGGSTVGLWGKDVEDQAPSIWTLQITQNAMSWIKRYTVSLELLQHRVGTQWYRCPNTLSFVERNGELVWKYLKGRSDVLEVLTYDIETQTIKYHQTFSPNCKDFYIETLVMLN